MLLYKKKDSSTLLDVVINFVLSIENNLSFEGFLFDNIKILKFILLKVI